MPSWIISQKDKTLLIVGGADSKFEIELENDSKSFFDNLVNNSFFKRSELSLNDQKILEQLLTAEIVVPRLPISKTLKVAVIGDQYDLNINNNKISVVKQINDSDLLLVLRVNSTFAELLAKINYQEISKPHLFLDVAYHHTVSIGPLVFPGETACIACLQGRIATRWGDDKPPSTPKVTSYNRLICGLIETELSRIFENDTSLTNKTISWNIQDRITKVNQLLKVPICPICTKNILAHSGSLELPWIKP